MNSQDDSGAARRVPASFTPTVAQRVAATEPMDEAAAAHAGRRRSREGNSATDPRLP